MSSQYLFGKTSGISTIAIDVVAVVVIAGLGGTIFFVLPQITNGNQGTPAVPGSMETCNGFLNLDEVKKITGKDDLAVTAAPAPDPSSSDPRMEKLCTITFIQKDSASALAVGVIKMVSVDAAESSYNDALPEMRAMAGAEVTEGVLGDNSILLKLNDLGLGSMAGAQVGEFFLVLTVTLPPGSEPLATPDQILDIGKLILKRLPN